MTHLLAQLKLPGANNSSVTVSYPQGFLFTGNVGLGGILNRAIPLILAFAGLGLLIMLIMAGYTFLTSAGDAKKMEQGKQQITNAIIGFLIVFVAYWVVQLVGVMFGPGVSSGFK